MQTDENDSCQMPWIVDIYWNQILMNTVKKDKWQCEVKVSSLSEGQQHEAHIQQYRRMFFLLTVNIFMKIFL